MIDGTEKPIAKCMARFNEFCYNMLINIKWMYICRAQSLNLSLGALVLPDVNF